jgi:hypothetical protein
LLRGGNGALGRFRFVLTILAGKEKCNLNVFSLRVGLAG